MTVTPIPVLMDKTNELREKVNESDRVRCCIVMSLAEELFDHMEVLDLAVQQLTGGDQAKMAEVLTLAHFTLQARREAIKKAEEEAEQAERQAMAPAFKKRWFEEEGSESATGETAPEETENAGADQG